MPMNVNQVMSALRRLQKEGHGKTVCEIFAGDQDPENPREGDGPVFHVSVYERTDGSVIVAIKA